MSTADVLGLVAEYKRANEHSPLVTRVLSELLEELQAQAKKSYLGQLYRTDFTVEGRGAFPVDMLRYCNAWPADESDARHIEESLEEADNTDLFVIRLTKYHRDAEPQLADDRWSSKFRWAIYRGRADGKRIDTRLL